MMHQIGGLVKNFPVRQIQKEANFKLKFAQATQMILKSAFIVLRTIEYHNHSDPQIYIY